MKGKQDVLSARAAGVFISEGFLARCWGVRGVADVAKSSLSLRPGIWEGAGSAGGQGAAPVPSSTWHYRV